MLPNPIDRRPLVAVGYGPRCVPVMQLAEAAAGICDLLWMIDGSIPEMGQMADLLNRFGPGGRHQRARRRADDQGADRPTGRTGSPPTSTPTWSAMPQVAAALDLPFHSARHGRRPHRQVPTAPGPGRSRAAHAGLPGDPPRAVRAGAGGDRGRGGLAGRPQAPVGPGEPLHLPRPRPGRPGPAARCAGSGPPGHGPRGVPGRRPGPGGRPLRGLRLGGEHRGRRRDQPPGPHRPLPAGGELPGDRVLHPRRPGPGRPGRRRSRWPPRPSRRSASAPAASTPRSSSPPTAPGSSRSTAASAAACRRCSSGPPASRCSS